MRNSGLVTLKDYCTTRKAANRYTAHYHSRCLRRFSLLARFGILCTDEIGLQASPSLFEASGHQRHHLFKLHSKRTSKPFRGFPRARLPFRPILFTALYSTSAVKPNSTLSYDDIIFGIPNLILCAEMVIFSLLHLYAYNVGPYKIGHASSRGTAYEGGPLGIKAIFASMNPIDFIESLFTAVGYALGKQSRRSNSYDDMGVQPLNANSQYPTAGTQQDGRNPPTGYPAHSNQQPAPGQYAAPGQQSRSPQPRW